MRTTRTAAAILAVVICLTGAVWALVRPGAWRRTDLPPSTAAQLQLKGVLFWAAAVPLNTSIAALDVPLNSWVRKGQVLGESGERATPDPSLEQAAEQRLEAAEAAVAAARAQLRAIESGVPAEIAAGDTEDAVEGGDRLDRRTPLQFVAMYQSRTALASSGLDGWESRRRDARAVLREAQQERRIAEAAVLNWAADSARVTVVSPADGVLVTRDDSPGAFEIAPDWRRLLVETIATRDQLTLLRTGQPATVIPDGWPSAPLRAVVDTIGPEQPGATGAALFPVTLWVTNPAGIKPGQTRVTVTLQPAVPAEP